MISMQMLAESQRAVVNNVQDVQSATKYPIDPTKEEDEGPRRGGFQGGVARNFINTCARTILYII